MKEHVACRPDIGLPCPCWRKVSSYIGLILAGFGAPISAKHVASLTDEVVLSLETRVLECDLHA